MIDADQVLTSAPRRHGQHALVLVSVVLLFAAGMLQFATLRYRHWPQERRVNNGSAPTFFAFHICPSYDFSEDFHLYYLRAKRIAQRGWTDSLLYSRPDERFNYSAPLQVVHGWLALTTEGSPRRYSIFIFATLAIGWSVLVLSTRRWLPRDVSSASILLAVLVTVLFEALHFVFSEPKFNSFGVWPPFRALRMSTMGWTSPVMLSAMIALTSLSYEHGRWKSTLMWLGLMTAALVCTDNWAFAIVWMASGLVACWIAISAIVDKIRAGRSINEAVVVSLGLLLLIIASYLGHELLNSSLEGDALLRGGVGSEWREAAPRTGTVVPMHQWFIQYALAPVIIVFLATLFMQRRVPSEQVPGCAPAHAAWGIMRTLVVLPIVSILALDIAMMARGMETFLRNQLYWRVDYCLLFAVSIAVAEWLRTAWPTLFGRWRYAWAVAVGIALTALFGYHNYRIHWFVDHVAARDFFLTADVQGMKPWLERFDKEHDRYELATASLELNYLCGFWTDADLLLPSGFPYHNSASNAEIVARVISLLQLYNASEASWLEFTKPSGRRFQDLWQESRIRASGEGYMYHLLHRWAYFTPQNGERKQADAIRQQIGSALQPTSAAVPLPAPEVILVDPVSSSIGQPNLQNYRLAHRSGAIEAWVRSDVTFSPLYVDLRTFHENGSRVQSE